MNDSNHFKYLYANIITFCRFWYITGEILNIPLAYLTAHFMTKYLILSSFPPCFRRNVNIFFSHRGKRKSHFVFLGALCFLLENLEREVLCSVFWGKRDGWSVTGYMIAQEAKVTAKTLSWIHLSILVDESVKVQVAKVQLLLCCSEQQNHFPRRKGFELLLHKSVFKANLFNKLFAWGFVKA